MDPGRTLEVVTRMSAATCEGVVARISLRSSGLLAHSAYAAAGIAAYCPQLILDHFIAAASAALIQVSLQSP